MKHHYLFSASLFAALATSSAVAANETPSSDDQNEIIVTGEKAARSLQKTTASVSVTTEKKLTEESILTIKEVYNRTANVSETYGSSGFSIRGIDQRGVSGGGDAATATVFVDGAPVPQDVL